MASKTAKSRQSEITKCSKTIVANETSIEKSRDTTMWMGKKEIDTISTSYNIPAQSSYSTHSQIKYSRNFPSYINGPEIIRYPFNKGFRNLLKYNHNKYKSEPRKRILEVASIFKSFYKKRLLCPTFILKTSTKPTYKTQVGNNTAKSLNKIKNLLKMSNNEFVVGVKGVKIMDAESFQPPPSPKFRKIRDLINKH